MKRVLERQTSYFEPSAKWGKCLSRGKSLEDTLNVGVGVSCTGCEDHAHRIQLWNEVPVSASPLSKLPSDETITSATDSDLQTPLSQLFPRKQEEAFMKVCCFLLCDGHAGSSCAEYVSSNLFDRITSKKCLDLNPELAIEMAVRDVDTEWLEKAEREDRDGMIGTALTLALMIDNRLYVANVGDGQAIIARSGVAHTLTKTHVPGDKEEKERIEKTGGNVFYDKRGSARLGHPVWNDKYVNIGVSRSIGDLYFKGEKYVGKSNSGLVSSPSLQSWEITKDDQFLIIASGGFWQAVKPDEAVLFVTRVIHLDSNSICKALLQLAKSRGSTHNCTIILVKLCVPKVPVEACIPFEHP